MLSTRQTNLLRAAVRKFAVGKIDLAGPVEALGSFREALVPVVRDAVAEVLPDLSPTSTRVAAEALIVGTARYLAAGREPAAKKSEKAEKKAAPKKTVKAVKAAPKKAAGKKGGKNGK